MDNLIAELFDPRNCEYITDEEYTPRWGRRTGKTFRQVLRALCKASEKDDTVVLYISNSIAHRDHAFRVACGVFDSSRVGENSAYGQVSTARKRIYLPNKSFVSFITVDQIRQQKGLRVQTVIKDVS